MDTLRDKIIPWYFVMFFVFIAIVDGIMVTIAIRTHTGTITDHPYERGLAYNQVVEAEKKQENLGWKGEVDLTKSKLIFTLRDNKNNILKADSVRADFIRPTQDGVDFSQNLKNIDNKWQADVNFPLSGLWQVRVYATVGDKTFQYAERIVSQ